MHTVFSTCLQAQEIQATLADQETNKAVYAAHVFIDNSSIGTTSDTGGFWKIDLRQQEFGKIVISHINYETINIDLKPDLTLPDTIFMREVSSELSNVELKVKYRPRLRKKRLAKFTEAILGEGKEADKTRIANPEDILLYEEAQNLHATATGPIEILNEFLGYRILFFLDEFAMSPDNDVRYTGSVRFTELNVESPKMLARYRKNRRMTYELSKRKFFHDLAMGSIDPDTYKISFCYLNRDLEFISIAYLEPDSVQISNLTTNSFSISIENYLAIKDNRIRSNKTGQFIGFSPNLGNEVKPIKSDMDNSGTSYISSRVNEIIIDRQGNVLNPLDLEEYGYWARRRLAHLLPRNYPSS